MDSQRNFVEKILREKKDEIIDANDRIFGYAELAYEETRSAGLLMAILEKEGFAVSKGLAGMPTCFQGVFGSGKPVIGFLGEFDALDGLSQVSGCPVRSPEDGHTSGHGCGHCGLGTASLAAAIAVKEYLAAEKKPGTVLYFGCPAEEGAGAKQFMARAGLFDGLDFAITWHPATLNEVAAESTTAIMGANFIFDGIASHAGATPWLGRSALDACELMNIGCNYLREHIPDGQRIHYAYSNAGGSAPNVVPAHAVIKYEVRALDVKAVKELFERVKRCAEGASLMTDTKMTCDITMAFSDFQSNSVLAKAMSECQQEIGAPKWDEEDYALARKFLDSYNPETRGKIDAELRRIFGDENFDGLITRPLHSDVIPYDPSKMVYEGGSTDVGDVSYVVPTAELHVATACLGNIGHTWQMTGQAGSRIMHRAIPVAAEIMALTALRMADRPDLIEKAKAETQKKNGGRYECPLPDTVQPPIGTY